MKTYDIYKFIIESNAKIPKKFRYSLGAGIEKSALDLMEYLILAKNAPKQNKSAYLIKSQAIQEVLTLKIRLLLELNLINSTRAFQTQSELEEIGKMIGGWLKSI
jgi:hypothetical protein